MIKIESALVGDAPFLREMIWEALMASPIFVQEKGLENIKKHEDEYWEKWQREPDPAFLAVDDEVQQKLGAIVLYPTIGDSASKEYRIGIAVRKEARGRGIGRQLILRAIDFAKNHQNHTMNLYVDPTNQGAIALYKSVGFKIINERDHELEMVLDLNHVNRAHYT